MRSKTMASSTMVNPASKPMPTCTEFSARTTGTPRPPAPTRAAITTMDRLSMMHWVMPAMMVDAALGNSTFHSSCMGVAPKASPASMSGFGTEEMPRWVRRIGRGQRKDHRRNQARHHAETEQHQGRNQVHEGRQGLHQIEHRPQRREQARPVRGGYSQRHADGRRGQGGDHDQRQSLEGRQPVTLIENEQQRQRHEDGERQASGAAPMPERRPPRSAAARAGRAATRSRRRPCRG